MFVCLEFEFSLVRRRHHCRWRTTTFYLCSTLMAFEKWCFFSSPHLLLHGASVYNGHLRGPFTYILYSARLAVELSLPVLTTSLIVRLRFEYPTFLLRSERSNSLRHRRGNSGYSINQDKLTIYTFYWYLHTIHIQT